MVFNKLYINLNKYNLNKYNLIKLFIKLYEKCYSNILVYLDNYL